MAEKKKRGFAAMPAEKQREIARKGGESVPAEKRREIGRKGARARWGKS